MAQNYPNPFNANTIIEFSIPTKSFVRIDIYNILGRKVATLTEGIKDAGSHQVVWDAKSMPSGAYFYQFDTDGITQTRKMLLIK